MIQYLTLNTIYNRRLLLPSRQKGYISPTKTSSASPSVESSLEDMIEDLPTTDPPSPSVDNLTDRIQTKFGLDDFNSIVSTVVQNEG
jgi:hypothetical protein